MAGLQSTKLFYKIGELSRLTGVEPYVLRYWESEFSALKPRKNRGGQRVYQEKDLELILLIKKLLREEGLTIAGARKRLSGPREKTAGPSETPAGPSETPAVTAGMQAGPAEIPAENAGHRRAQTKGQARERAREKERYQTFDLFGDAGGLTPAERETSGNTLKVPGKMQGGETRAARSWGRQDGELADALKRCRQEIKDILKIIG